MKNPYNAPLIVLLIISIVTSGIGFMLIGIWVGDKLPHNDWLLVCGGLAYVIMAIGVGLIYHEIARKQSTYDSGNTSPSEKY